MDNELLVHVHGQGLEVGPPLREMVDGRVREALGHLADKLTRVDVHLRDLNADKGGIDKRCVCEARPRGMDPIAAENESADLQEAVHGAVAKLVRALRHRFDKRDWH